MPDVVPSVRARDLLRQAQELHAARRTDEAIAKAWEAIEAARDWHEPWMYLGTTLVTRKLAFEDGLRALEHAVELAPGDPGAHYSLGWCYEFVAYRLEKEPNPPRDPHELYALAADELQRCIELNPELGLQEDAQDLLDTVLDRF